MPVGFVGITGIAHDTDTPSAKLRRAFGTLGLVQDESCECTEEDIRNAYLNLAKRYHPDSRTMEADADQFISVSTEHNSLARAREGCGTRD